MNINIIHVNGICICVLRNKAKASETKRSGKAVGVELTSKAVTWYYIPQTKIQSDKFL